MGNKSVKENNPVIDKLFTSEITDNKLNEDNKDDYYKEKLDKLIKKLNSHDKIIKENNKKIENFENIIKKYEEETASTKENEEEYINSLKNKSKKIKKTKYEDLSKSCNI